MSYLCIIWYRDYIIYLIINVVVWFSLHLFELDYIIQRVNKQGHYTKKTRPYNRLRGKQTT